MCLQLGCVRRHFLHFATLALDAGARRLQCLRRSGLVASLPLLVEMHRRGVQAQRQRRGFARRRRPAEIFPRELGKPELRLTAHLPQEVGIDPGRDRLRIGEQYRRRRTRETQQYVRRLELQALAGNRFDLERGIVVGEDGAGLERAVVLEKNMHGKRNCEGWSGELYRSVIAFTAIAWGHTLLQHVAFRSTVDDYVDAISPLG